MAHFSIGRASGGYRARYYSGGNLVWWSEVYTRKEGAKDAIASIKRYGPTAPVYDRTTKAA